MVGNGVTGKNPKFSLFSLFLTPNFLPILSFNSLQIVEINGIKVIQMPQKINHLPGFFQSSGMFWCVDESNPMYYIQMA